MIACSIFGTMAVISAIGPEWASTANTFLLVVLAVITLIAERAARRERQVVKDNTEVAIEAAATIDKKVTDVRQHITGNHRDPTARTREDDESPWQPQ